VILTHNRGAPVGFEYKDVLVGPPLTRSSAAVLAEAGVKFGLAISDSGKSFLTINYEEISKQPLCHS
jgi:hypothetical protein